MITRLGVFTVAFLAIAPHASHGQQSPSEALHAVERKIEAHEYQAAREALLRWKEADTASASADARVRADYLEAVLADDPVIAERLFLAVAIDHPSSPEAADALLRVGQSRYAAREHDRARTVFDRLLHDYPDSDARLRGAYWAILNHLASGRQREACGTLEVVRGSNRQPLRERLSHLDLGCAEAPGPPADRPERPAPDEDRRPVVVEAGPFSTTTEAVVIRDRLVDVGLPAMLVRRSVEEGTRVWIGDPGPRAERQELADRARALGIDVKLSVMSSDE